MRPHDIALPCAKLQAVTRLSQNKIDKIIMYMMRDGWHSHYLPYLSSGQQAVTGHWRCHWDRGLCSRPPGSASLTSLAHSMMVKWGAPPFVHFITASSSLPSRQTSFACNEHSKMWARGLHSLRLASRLNGWQEGCIRKAGLLLKFVEYKCVRRAGNWLGSNFSRLGRSPCYSV